MIHIFENISKKMLSLQKLAVTFYVYYKSPPQYTVGNGVHHVFYVKMIIYFQGYIIIYHIKTDTICIKNNYEYIEM